MNHIQTELNRILIPICFNIDFNCVFWFDEECLGLLDQRKRAKIQWIQDPSQNNADNLIKVRREVSRHFRNKKKTYLRAKIEELETNN